MTGTLRTLYLMRHAQAHPPARNQQDHERPLDEHGLGQAVAQAEWLVSQGHIPAVLWSSDALRTRTTAETVVTHMQEHGAQKLELRLHYKLYNAELRKFMELLQKLPDDASSALVVGHNMGISEVASVLCGQAIQLEPADVVALQLHQESWKLLGAETCSLLWQKRAELQEL